MKIIKRFDWALIVSMAVFLTGLYLIYRGFEIRSVASDQLKGTNITLYRAWSGIGLGYRTMGGLMCLCAIFGHQSEMSRRNQQATIDRLNWSLERISAIETLKESGKSRLEGAKWPWGSHHTELLGQLEAAATRFWTLYDPADPTTAPTNEMVATWLRDEKGVSKEKAQAIASILRADGLRTGPRG